MEIYFDNSATTQCCQEAVDAMVRVMTKDYGNPSSLHKKGVEAENLVKEAAASVARTLKCTDKEILFTSGGTESNNLALFGTCQAHKRAGMHVVTTAVEHAAVLSPMDRLEEGGFEVTRLPVDGEGRISLSDLENALREDTILVSMMHVNNEVGTVEPIEEAARLVHEKTKALFHVDAIQSYGKFALRPGRTGIDLLSVSSHKIHGPKGCGFLYIGKNARILPQILGGGQQGGMRSGTDNVPGIVGLGIAAERAYEDLEGKRTHLYAIKKQLAGGLAALPDVVINGPDPLEGAPQILNASFLGIRAEVLLHALEEKGIYVSSGSACSSHKKKGSGTLYAMGLPLERRESAIRFSFCPENTSQEVEECLKALAALVPRLRKFSRR